MNSLDVADDTVFRDKPMRFILGAAGPASAEKLRKNIKTMRKSGEFANLVNRIRLE